MEAIEWRLSELERAVSSYNWSTIRLAEKLASSRCEELEREYQEQMTKAKYSSLFKEEREKEEYKARLIEAELKGTKRILKKVQDRMAHGPIL